MNQFTPASARPVVRAVAAIATTSIAALMISSALAQQPPAATSKPPAPARPAATPAKPPASTAKPAAPTPAQPGQPAGQAAAPAQPQLIYSQWLKFCIGPDGQPADQKDPAVKAKQVCMTGLDGRMESGQPVVAIVAIEPAGDGKKLLRITLPVGMQLQHGTRVIVDQEQPLQAPYVTCFANGCLSDYELTADTLAKLKKGKTIYVQGINIQGTALSVPLPLTEFAKVFDSPPADPKVLEERQKKLEEELKRKGEELQKKANEARQKLEQSGAKPQ